VVVNPDLGSRWEGGHEMQGEISRVFSAFSNWLAKWMGSHWAFAVAAVAVLIGLLTVGVEDTNIAISIVTLLMVFVLQNTQNRDSTALHSTRSSST
jgi:low affinity Fe/Cu permease